MRVADPEIPLVEASASALETDKKLPDELILARCRIEVLEAEAGDAASLPKVEMLAYNGGIMRVGMWGDVVINLQGMKIPRQVKFMADHVHAVRATVGYGKGEVRNNKLHVTGVLSLVSEDARIIAGMAAEGLEWEASLTAQPLIWQYIGPGASVEANGKTLKASGNGFTYIKRSILKGMSILPTGADEKTRVKIAAEAALFEGGSNMKFAEWLKAKGFTLEELSDEQKATLKAAYDAEIKAAADNADPKPEKPAKQPAGQPVEAGAPGPGIPPAAQDDSPKPEDLAAKVVEDIRAEVAKESERIAAVRKACGGQHADIEAKAISEGWTAEKAELEVLRASRPQAPQIVGRPDTAVSAVMLEAALRLGGPEDAEVVEKAYEPQVLEAAYGFRHIGLKELIAISCAIDGNPRPRLGAGADGYIEAAFSTVSLSGILGVTANKIALDAYKAIESAARKVCQKLNANDFKTHTGYRMTGDTVPDEVGEDGELKSFEIGEESFTFRIATYGNILTITRQMIYNDDLNVFTKVPQMFGRGSALLIERLFFALLHANTGNFFHGNNSNLITDALASAGLSTAVQTLVEQTDADGHPIVLNPKVLMVPPALKADADELYVSRNLASGTAAKVPDANVHAGKYVPVTSPYLSNTSFHASASSTAWYLFGDPNDIGAFGLAYLKGNEVPTFEPVSLPNNILGKGWRGYFDVGVCQMEPEGAVKSDGSGE